MCLCYLLLEKEKKNNIHTDALGVFANYLKLQKNKNNKQNTSIASITIVILWIMKK
jgi:hypothetical protein